MVLYYDGKAKVWNVLVEVGEGQFNSRYSIPTLHVLYTCSTYLHVDYWNV